MLEDLAALRGVDHARDRAQLDDAGDGEQHFRAVLHQHGHGVATTDTAAFQEMRDLVGPLVELRVGVHPVFEAQGNLIGSPLCLMLQQRADGGRPLLVQEQAAGRRDRCARQLWCQRQRLPSQVAKSNRLFGHGRILRGEAVIQGCSARTSAAMRKVWAAPAGSCK